MLQKINTACFSMPVQRLQSVAMYPTESLVTFSFPLGRVSGVPFRLSFLLPVVVIALMWRLQAPVAGLLGGTILLLSLLTHEFAHLVVAQHYRYHPGTVVIWPLGGLYLSPMPFRFRAVAMISLAGPLINFALAGLAALQLPWEVVTQLANPLGRLTLGNDNDLAGSCLRFLFFFNWCLGLLNLIPLRPLDGGQVFASFLNLRFLEMETQDLMLRLGLVTSLFGIMAGFVFDSSSLLALSAFLFVIHIHEASRWVPPQDEPDESEENYAHDTEDQYQFDRQEMRFDDSDDNDGILERWRSRRDEEKARFEEEQRLLDERLLDAVLEKLHSHGRESLSSRELSLLNRVSARLRQRNLRE